MPGASFWWRLSVQLPLVPLLASSCVAWMDCVLGCSSYAAGFGYESMQHGRGAGPSSSLGHMHCHSYALALVPTPHAPRLHQFQHNPLATGPPHLRFFAGAPLVALAPACRSFSKDV